MLSGDVLKCRYVPDVLMHSTESVAWGVDVSMCRSVATGVEVLW